ncbi:alpha/beta fold hydrolase [Labrys wisconsinensis]|uniref:Haloacetate dehalogenase n=1 Tax=Labrys wisconsinensis TaxID=425677 RepID=A0ABU0J3Z0_9HYPH|nr:alpha/beta hydrolase [Labrys wisconsinensis]MDQ0468949.1 haloacetate dehalogenase [Labrys wisconsinensis]
MQSRTGAAASPAQTAMPPLAERHASLMEGFSRRTIRTSGAEINVAVGGEGPPLLLLHGNPLTHVSWHRIAPTLARSFTVVAPDLRGYGDSSKPDGGPDHAAYTFRAMGEDAFDVMDSLGFDSFALAGHDRGARVGFRMALDRPERVSRFCALDIIPTHHLLTNVTLGWGLESYHWFFMAQKAPFPERLICADLDYYIQYKLNKKGVGLEIFTPEALAEYARCTTPAQIHAVCEDYRATVTLDLAMDSTDFGKRRIGCPVLVLWGSNSHVGRHLKPIEAWSPWAEDLRGWAIPTGHYPAEHRPDLVYESFWTFFNGGEPRPYSAARDAA